MAMQDNLIVLYDIGVNFVNKKIKAILIASVSAFVTQSAAFSCTITPTPTGVFYGTGIVGQYCWVNPPVGGAVTGQCWGMTSSGGTFHGPSFGWRPFVGTATPTGAPINGYDLNVTSDFCNAHVHCNEG